MASSNQAPLFRNKAKETARRRTRQRPPRVARAEAGDHDEALTRPGREGNCPRDFLPQPNARPARRRASASTLLLLATAHRLAPVWVAGPQLSVKTYRPVILLERREEHYPRQCRGAVAAQQSHVGRDLHD